MPSLPLRACFGILCCIGRAAPAAHRVEARMRKFVITGVAALGFVTIGLTAMGHATTFQQTNDADGAAASGRMNRPDVVAMVKTDIANRAQLLIANGYAGLPHSLVVG
jgi:hypothetical protein